jgi:hypothetical protein
VDLAEILTLLRLRAQRAYRENPPNEAHSS